MLRQFFLTPCKRLDAQACRGPTRLCVCHKEAHIKFCGPCRHEAWSEAVALPHLFLGGLPDGAWGEIDERPPEPPTQPLRRHDPTTSRHGLLQHTPGNFCWEHNTVWPPD